MSSGKVVGMAEWKKRIRGEFELTADKLLEKAWSAAGICKRVSTFHMPEEPEIFANVCVVETQKYAQLANHTHILARSVHKVESKTTAKWQMTTAKWQIFQVVDHGPFLHMSPVSEYEHKGYIDHWLPIPTDIPEVEALIEEIDACLHESWEKGWLSYYDDLVLKHCYSSLSTLLGLTNAEDHDKAEGVEIEIL